MITVGDKSLDTPNDTRSDASPWTGWLQTLHPPEGDAISVESVLTWLARVHSQITLRLEGYTEALDSLTARWHDILAQPHPPSQQELRQVVDGLLRSTEHRAAAEALKALVELTRSLVGQLPVAERLPKDAHAGASNADTLLLLESVSSDRVRLAAMAAGDLLDILAKVVIALEDGEDQLAANPAARHQVFDTIHNHVARGADELRRRFLAPAPTSSAQGLTAAIREVCASTSGVSVKFVAEGPDVVSTAAVEALLWSLQEILHHVRSSTIESIAVGLHSEADGPTTVTVATPSRAFAIDTLEPTWLLRTRLRMELVGGVVTPHVTQRGSTVEIRVG